jgi:hypothetical protein
MARQHFGEKSKSQRTFTHGSKNIAKFEKDRHGFGRTHRGGEANLVRDSRTPKTAGHVEGQRPGPEWQFDTRHLQPQHGSTTAIALPHSETRVK